MVENIKKDRQVLKTIEEMEGEAQWRYIYPTEVKDEIQEEMIVRALFRIIDLGVLSFGAVDSVYDVISNISEKDRVYEAFRIYKELQLQKLANEGLISHSQLNNLIPIYGIHYFSVELDGYWINFDSEINEKFKSSEVLDSNIIWILYLIATNLDIDEDVFCYFYYELKNLDYDESTLEREVANLIVRLRIREMRNKGILTEADETIFMSKIQEYDLTYQFFEEEEILNWKHKAFHSLNLGRNKGV